MPLAIVTFAAALGCGLVAGVFFAFSTGVMPALARLPPAQGVAAMQAINVAVINRWFLGALVGTAALCALLLGATPFTWSAAGGAAPLRLAGSGCYLVGAILVTRVCHIPRNDALAAVAPEEAAARWSRYLVEWTAWNHLRAAAALLACALLVVA